MWWEAIPSGAIIGVCFVLPNIFAYGVNYVFLGNPYRRAALNNVDLHCALRDHRLGGGDEYKQIGLENISLDEGK